MILQMSTRTHTPGHLRLLAFVATLTVMVFSAGARAQFCPPPPENPQFWVECGQCRGDLNADGLLDEFDLMTFDIYKVQFPQNLCADFDDDGVVDTADLQILNCVVNESYGACREACGDPANRDCFTPAVPGGRMPGGCSDASCCSAVCNADPLCCGILWDANCVNIAENICVANAPDNQPDAGNCLCDHEWEITNLDCLFEHGYPGCSDARCRELVCASDPACCVTVWDTTCVELVKQHCQTPCSNLVLQEEVCKIDPNCCEPSVLLDGTLVGDWDAACATIALGVIRDQPGLNIQVFPSNALLCAPVDPTPKQPDPLQAQLDRLQLFLCLLNPAYCAPAGNQNFDQDIQECLATLSINYPGCRDLFQQGEWDAACVQIADQLCRWPEPLTRGLGNCLTVRDLGGCSDGYCSQLVCELDPTCCNTAWDQKCVDLAALQCVLVPADVTGQPDVTMVGSTSVEAQDGLYRCGSPATGNCCYQSFTPYCEDAACCQIVCGYDAYCCDVRWDEYCAQLATAGCEIQAPDCTCGPKLIEFGPLNRSCFEARELGSQYLTGCQDAECCNAVCYIDSYCCEAIWDELCAEGALEVCSPFDDLFPGCGDILAGSCNVPGKTPYCDDIACCQNVCIIDVTCCTTAWDESCVELAQSECNQCGDILAGSCLAGGSTPACSDEDCCEAVCEIDSFCCTDRWDSACASLAQGRTECKLTEVCGLPTARNCYIQAPLPGCSDATCCTSICVDFDAYCCEVRWDAVCAQQAINACDPPAAGGSRDSCLTRHGSPGCNDAVCSAQVCATEGFEYCCTNRWDAGCVKAAKAVCGGLYECPGIGSCFTPHPTPMCDDPSCCNVVCTFDPRCCDTEWDNLCGTIALDNCSRLFNSDIEDLNCPCEGSCFEARDSSEPRPGCEDESCCVAVCRIDEACCTIDWDQNCATTARFYCGSDLQCGASVAGSCTESHDTPFCDDTPCCEAVCTIDPICCTTRWDSFCVSFAEERCRRGCGLESAGPCFYPHLNPGCSDAECCDAVCEIDPICCSAAWDATCANEALQSCEVPECGDFPAGKCCEVNFSPSCNDKRCCESVCDTDPICCDSTWDLECVRLARQDTRCNCGANWDCGDPCAGGCCVPNFTPKCDDETCCDAVCAQDSFCCDAEWDLVCAGMALANDECTDPDGACPAPQCGDPNAGDCCFANGTPNCSDETCCETVIAIDAACESGWDTICASLAQENCEDLCINDLACGDSETGPCDEPHPGPFCDTEDVCECVCVFEPFCCIGDWDETCVFIATQICD